MKILAGHVAGMVAALALVCAPVAAQAQRGGGHGGGGHFGGGGHVGGGGGFRGGGGYRGGGYHGGGFYRGGVVYRGGYGWGGYPGWGWGWGLYSDPWLWGWPGYYGDYPGYYYDPAPEQAPPVPQGSVDSYAPNAAPATPPSTACGYWQWGEDKQYHWVTNNACQ